MFLLIALWLVFFTLSFGAVGFVFISMKKAASRPWRLRVDESYSPKVSILVPTYNEAEVIGLKLENLRKLEYPAELMEIVLVDSNSCDHTIDIVKDFLRQHPDINMQVLVEEERRGKSAALNFALKHSEGDVVIVSDADCFWPCDILRKTLPFLADSEVGAISGPKKLLNPLSSWVTKTENAYLKSINLVKSGESKLDSTLLFEGGFSAYRRGVIDLFDPYNTGSDDCGTVIRVIEKESRAILVPEAAFFTAFPTTYKGKTSMKARRANQIVRVFCTYLSLFLQRRIKSAKLIVIQDIFLYLFSPVSFILLLLITPALLISFPYFLFAFLTVLIPKVRLRLVDLVPSYILLFISLLSLFLKKKFIVWNKSGDRAVLTEDMLRRHKLI